MDGSFVDTLSNLSNAASDVIVRRFTPLSTSIVVEHELQASASDNTEADPNNSALAKSLSSSSSSFSWRAKLVAAALVLCLNVGVDPPDVIKPEPCARLECWLDPASMPAQKALEAIGKALQAQYECKPPPPCTGNRPRRTGRYACAPRLRLRSSIPRSHIDAIPLLPRTTV